jgi:cysteine synthase
VLPVRRLETTKVEATHISKQPAISHKVDISRTVYKGDTALKEYLDPANYAPPPLIELPHDLNPFRSDGVRLFAKMMPLVPLMNIKSLPTFSMLSEASEHGKLQGVEHVIESSSCNTALSLSVMARLFGIQTTYAVVDDSIALSLLRTLRLFGIDILLHSAIESEPSEPSQPRSERAASIGKQPGWYCPSQYSNNDNPKGIGQWLGPDLWAQTEGRLQILSCGLGTCGTMVGAAQALRQYNPAIQVVANIPAPGNYIPGPREQSLLEDVAFPWRDIASTCFELTAEESFAASIKLLRRGILGGPSSGMNYAGLLHYIEHAKSNGTLNSLIDKQGELWCVFLCCDSPFLHIDEYYAALGDSYFPVVHSLPNSHQMTEQLI